MTITDIDIHASFEDLYSESTQLVLTLSMNVEGYYDPVRVRTHISLRELAERLQPYLT